MRIETSSAVGVLSRKPAPLPNLTAFRLFAASLVLALHVTGGGRAFLWTRPLQPFLSQGFTGVSMFFVLSGFVLAYNHIEVKHPLRFYMARLARIYPLYLLGLLWMVAFQALAALRAHDVLQMQPLTFIASLLMLQTWYMPMIGSFNLPGWTLSIEAFFYLLFPLLIRFVLPRTGAYWRWMMAVWLLFLLPPVLSNYGPVWFGWRFSPGLTYFLHGFLLSPMSRVGEFLVGVFAGARFRKQPWRASGLSVFGMACVCVTAIYFSGHIAHEVVRDDAMALLYAGLLLLLAGWKSPVLASAPMQLGGEISYGIYLLQYPLEVTLLGIGKRVHLFSIKIPLLLILPVLAYTTYILVEKPARRWILDYFHLRGGRKPLPTPARMP